MHIHVGQRPTMGLYRVTRPGATGNGWYQQCPEALRAMNLPQLQSPLQANYRVQTICLYMDSCTSELELSLCPQLLGPAMGISMVMRAITGIQG